MPDLYTETPYGDVPVDAGRATGRQEAANTAAEQTIASQPIAEVISRQQPLVECRPPDAMSIIHAAIERGRTADELGKLFDMQERNERDRRLVAYNQAMNSCQGEMPTVIKDKRGGKSNYAPLETIKFAIKPIYIKHGFSTASGEADCPVPGHVRVWLEVRHNQGHVERFWGDFPNVAPNAAMNPTQCKIGTMTYAERKLTAMAFGVTIADEDRDGANQQDAGVINDDQVIELDNYMRDLAEIVGAQAFGIWRPKFMAWLGVTSIMQIPVGKFKAAVEDVQAQIKKRSKR